MIKIIPNSLLVHLNLPSSDELSMIYQRFPGTMHYAYNESLLPKPNYFLGDKKAGNGVYKFLTHFEWDADSHLNFFHLIGEKS